MDNGRPFRVSRGQERKPAAPSPQTTNRHEPVDPPQPPRTPSPRPQPATPVAARRRPLWVGIVGAIILLALGYGLGHFLPQSSGLAIDTKAYQAVTTSDGQIYFGKVITQGRDSIKIDTAYYLQAETAQPTADDDADNQSVGKLIRVSNKPYGPAGSIVIARDKILSYEKLDPDGQVAKLLAEKAN